MYGIGTIINNTAFLYLKVAESTSSVFSAHTHPRVNYEVMDMLPWSWY